MILSKKLKTKALIRLRECAGWSAPVLFANPQRQVLSRRGLYNPDNNPENFNPCDMVLPVLLGSLGVYLIFLLSIHSLYLYVGVGNGVSLFLPFDLKWKTYFFTLCMMGKFECFCHIYGFKEKNTLQEHSRSVKHFGSRSYPTFCCSWSGSKLLAKVVSRQQQVKS